MSRLTQLLLLEEVSVRCSGIFTPLISILVEVATTNFWCVLRRGTRLRDRGPVTNSKPLLQENDPLASVVPREDDQNGPRSDAGAQLPHVLTE